MLMGEEVDKERIFFPETKSKKTTFPLLPHVARTWENRKEEGRRKIGKGRKEKEERERRGGGTKKEVRERYSIYQSIDIFM